jgi:hypothetical protein
VGTATQGIQDLQSESSSSNDQNDSKSDTSAKNTSYNNADWATSGHNVNILFDDTGELTAEETNSCAQQKINKKDDQYMKRKNYDIDWMSTKKKKKKK